MTQPKRGYVRLSVADWTLLYDPREGVVNDVHLPESYIWTEMDDGSIVSGIRVVNRVRYIATHLPHPPDVDIYVEDVYDVDFCDERGMTPIDELHRGINLPQIMETAQYLANERQKKVVVIFINGERDDMEVEPDATNQS